MVGDQHSFLDNYMKPQKWSLDNSVQQAIFAELTQYLRHLEFWNYTFVEQFLMYLVYMLSSVTFNETLPSKHLIYEIHANVLPADQRHSWLTAIFTRSCIYITIYIMGVKYNNFVFKLFSVALFRIKILIYVSPAHRYVFPPRLALDNNSPMPYQAANVSAWHSNDNFS